jgi:hypothetical protein
MGRVLSRDVPIFAGLRELDSRSRASNRMIFCVMDDAKIDEAIAMVQEVCGALDEPGRRHPVHAPRGDASSACRRSSG